MFTSSGGFQVTTWGLKCCPSPAVTLLDLAEPPPSSFTLFLGSVGGREEARLGAQAARFAFLQNHLPAILTWLHPEDGATTTATTGKADLACTTGLWWQPQQTGDRSEQHVQQAKTQGQGVLRGSSTVGTQGEVLDQATAPSPAWAPSSCTDRWIRALSPGPPSLGTPREGQGDRGTAPFSLLPNWMCWFSALCSWPALVPPEAQN